MQRLIVGNWKINLDIKQAEVLIDRLRIHTPKPTARIVLCPGFTQLPLISQKVREFDQKIWAVGAQNISEHDEGAFTGEVSAPMLKGLVKYCIVGHSERRIYFGETDKQIALKVAACIRAKMTPILCVGEDLRQRQEGLAKCIVLDQLDEGLSELTRQEVAKVVIAYEPVWAIGTGKNAVPTDIEKMLSAIYQYLIQRYRADVAAKVSLLYGGSIRSSNASAYLNTHACSGLLVGGASLNYREFSKICQL